MTDRGNGQEDMEQDELDSLLGQGYEVPPPGREFTDRLEARLHERLQQRTGTKPPAEAGHPRRLRRAAVLAALATAAAVLLVVGLSVLGPDDKSPAIQLSAEDVVRLQNEIRQLEAEANRRMAEIELMQLREQHTRVEARLAAALQRPNPDIWVQTETERAASIMVAGADRMVRKFKLIESAAALYRRTIELFPNTRGAGTARRRLSEIQPS